MNNENHGCLWWLLIGWWYAPLQWLNSCLTRYLSQSTNAPQDPLEPEPSTPAPSTLDPHTSTPQPKVEHHRIAGTSFRMDDIKKLLEEDPTYDLNKRELIEDGYINERVYKLSPYTNSAVLEPEPDNPTDPKAIKVLTEGVHIGYIKAGSCAHIHKLLREGRIERAEVEIKGGAYKIVLARYDEFDNGTYSLERDTVPFFAVLSLTLK